MLNLWITNVSDTEEPENNSTSDFDDSSLSPIRVEDWDTDIVDNPTTEEYHLYPGSTPPVANFPDGALLSPGALSSAPVVSTEGGSSEFPAPDSMPSARFFYSNPPSSVSNRRNPENRIQGSNPHPHPPHSSHRRPQIHVQVNLPGSTNPNPSSSAVQHQNYAHEPVQNSMSGMNPVPMAGNQCVDSRAMNSPSNGHYYSGMQRPDIPMLFHGSSYADNPMMSPSSKSAHSTAEAGEGSFYSAFQPEVDFLEFQSMYFHLCKFYHKYGHANACKHGDYFVLGSWVEKLRQRKHIQDLQESGISVAASLNPISKRQSQLLESLGFRWHISASENAMIIQHMNFVDNAHARQVQSESQIEKPCPGAARTQNLTVTKPEDVKPPQQSSQLRNQKPGMTVPSNASLDANLSSTRLPHHGPKGYQKQQTLIAPKTEVTPSQTKTEVPVVKRKRKKSAKDHANVSLARMQQQAENIKACEGIIAKHDNSFKEASQTKDKNKKSELQAPKILIDPNVDTAEHLWKCQFAKLSEYKRIHGDCTVPARFSEDPKLGHWVMTQRRQFNLMKKGKPSSMTVERMKLLNDIGFSWSIRIDPEKMWNLRYEQLQQYQANYGDCLVPQRFSENPKLGTWVNTQRRHFKLMNEGKSSCMNEERVKLLEKIKFVWSTSIVAGSTGMKNENNEGKISCKNGGNKVDVVNPKDAEGKTGIESGNFDESREVGEGLSTLSAAANVIAAMHYDGGNFYDEGEDEKS